MEQFSAEPLNPSEEVISHNVAMLGAPMHALLAEESWGGNAGGVEVNGKYYPCAGANGYAEPGSGKIVAFGNTQQLPSELREQNGHIIFRVSGYRFEITGWNHDDGFSAEAVLNLEKSIARYNAGREDSDSIIWF